MVDGWSLIISELEAVHMENRDYRDLGKLFGKPAIWGRGYLPCSEKKTDGVLSKLLDQETGYDKYIGSLQSYRSDYAQFSDAYYRSLPPGAGKEQYTCVPYWGSEFWKPKSESSLRLAVFAQGSLNRDGASIPLYFPLCEIDTWEKAFEVGVELGREQPGKEQPKSPFGWQSFMSVWIAMRFLFSGYEQWLQNVYYSDRVKIPDDKKRNWELLKKETNIIKPDFVLVFGKKDSHRFECLLQQAGARHIHFICFPCGQGAIHDRDAKELRDCREKLRDYFDSHQ
jgi:hypothetical protein